MTNFNQELLRISTETAPANKSWFKSLYLLDAAIIAERSEMLLGLMERDPVVALVLALPESILEHLRQSVPSILPGLEERGAWKGHDGT